jgi:DNA-binding transcriptional regulator YiaG
MSRHESNRQKQPELAERLREIREDLCGEYGAQFLADALKVRVETWLNYESGATAPAHVVLKLIDIARVNPHWLLTGQGDPHDDRKCHRESGRPPFGAMSGSN